MPSPLTLPVRYTRHQPPLGAPIRSGQPLAPRGGALWPMNAGAGGVACDATQTRNHATLNAGAIWVPTSAGRGVQVPSGGYLEAPWTPVLDTVGIGVSLAVTFRLDALTTAAPSFLSRAKGSSPGSGGGWTLFVNTGGANQVYLAVKDVAGNQTAFFGATSLVVGHTYRVVCVVPSTAGQTASIYVNGNQDASGAIAYTWSYLPNLPTRFGRAQDTFWGNFQGTYLAASIYPNRLLSPAEIRSLYLAPYQVFG
jgi:hypothetical protein